MGYSFAIKKRNKMFDKKFKIVLFLGVLIILGILFGQKLMDSLSSVEDISTFTESKSVGYYKKSCEYENSRVCNELGDMYHYGNDILSVDYDDAFKYYEKSCDLEDGRGCNNLAYMYDEGIGIARQNWTALKLYRKACKYNEMEACYNVGSMYYLGEGSKKNYANAVHYFKKSCNNGIGAGCNNLGYMYEHGKYFASNLNEAISHYGNACDMGESSGCKNLAHLKEKRGNLVSAKQLYKKACILGDDHSCNRLESVLGSHIYIIQDDRELEEAISACDRSTLGGTMCYRVGLYYEEAENHDKARDFFEKACQREQSRSCKHLGDLYR